MTPITLTTKRKDLSEALSVEARLDFRWLRLQQQKDTVLLAPDQVEALIAAYRKKYKKQRS